MTMPMMLLSRNTRQIIFTSRCKFKSTGRWNQQSLKRSLATATSNSSTNDAARQHYDVIIVGGGAVGSVLAHQLARKVPSLKISLIDARTPRSAQDVLKAASATTPNARAYALSPTSLNLLDEDIDINAGSDCDNNSDSNGGGHGSVLNRLNQSGRVAFYDSMQVWESDGPATLHFTTDDLDLSSSNVGNKSGSYGPNTQNILGAVIEDEPLVSCVWDDLRRMNKSVDGDGKYGGNNHGTIDLISSVSIKSITPSKPISKQDHCSPVELTYESNNKNDSSSTTKTISTNLLIAADGANSFVRNSIGGGSAFPTVNIAYGRKAVTCTVEIDGDMKRIAHQRFHPNGPIALLPIWDNNDSDNKKGGDGVTYANIVWSTTPQEAEELQKLSETEFIQRINANLQTGPTTTPPLVSNELKSSMPTPLHNAVNGLELLSSSINTGLTMSGWTERERGFVVPPVVKGVVGRVFSFDLNLMHVRNYVGDRVALVGDAAHTIHPMAGQGLNLGMADVQCIVKNIKHAVESGMGISGSGVAGLEYALKQYESERQREVVAVMGGIQFLHGVFGTTFAPAVHARSVGMNLVNSVGPIRRKLVKVAAGVDGVL